MFGRNDHKHFRTASLFLAGWVTLGFAGACDNARRSRTPGMLGLLAYAQAGIDDQPPVVRYVDPLGPSAGLRRGDRLLSVGGRSPDRAATDGIGRHVAGDSVAISVRRGNELASFRVEPTAYDPVSVSRMRQAALTESPILLVSGAVAPTYELPAANEAEWENALSVGWTSVDKGGCDAVQACLSRLAEPIEPTSEWECHPDIAAFHDLLSPPGSWHLKVDCLRRDGAQRIGKEWYYVRAGQVVPADSSGSDLEEEDLSPKTDGPSKESGAGR